MRKLYLDSETCGLHGMPVLFQYAVEEGPIVLYDIWRKPVRQTLRLVEWFLEHTIVGFNLSFDMFQAAKCYTVFRLCDPDWIPEEHIDEIAMLEPLGRDGPCIKPAGALDLMLHSRKGPYQSLMSREDIRIKKVPSVLAQLLADKLEEMVHLDDIYFARSADKDAPRWKVFDRKDKDGEIDREWKDVVLTFNPAGGLKFLAEFAMGYEPKFHYKDVEPPREWNPYELGYAPFALAVARPESGWAIEDGDDPSGRKSVRFAWPGVIRKFINHWATHESARQYASDDIVYTRALDHHFGNPEPNDNDSVLACMVPVVRWHGFTIDIPAIEALMAKARDVVAQEPVNTNKPAEVRRYLFEAMDDMEQSFLEDTTEKAKLEAIEKNWTIDEDEVCQKCLGDGCLRCNYTGELKKGTKHPAAARAREILNVKVAKKEIELYTKLLKAGRLHASFVVVGTLSSRMAGADGLNPQGIKRTKEVRRCFPLAWDGMFLCGGDMDSFEVCLADAVYHDANLRKALTTKVPCHKCDGTGCENCEGTGKTPMKIHALFGMSLFPGTTYEEVMASEGSDFDMYGKGKSGIFGMIYGGDWSTLVKNLSIKETAAKAAFEDFGRRYPGVNKAREKTFDAFCSMRQPGGIGTAVIWADPADYVESFLGFRRYFTLENKVCKALFDLARKPPQAWREVKVKVVRRDRVQPASGAVASALYAAAFGMQAANMRAAANHEIQSPGGEITKAVQRAIWDIQPVGVHDWLVAPMNVHDEIQCVTHPSAVKEVTAQVRKTVESYRPQVPLIGMTWFEEMANWAEKKGGAAPVKIRAPEMMAA